MRALGEYWPCTMQFPRVEAVGSLLPSIQQLGVVHSAYLISDSDVVYHLDAWLPRVPGTGTKVIKPYRIGSDGGMCAVYIMSLKP